MLNECVNVCTWCPVMDSPPIHAEFSGLITIQHDPDQDNAVTEDELLEEINVKFHLKYPSIDYIHHLSVKKASSPISEYSTYNISATS